QLRGFSGLRRRERSRVPGPFAHVRQLLLPGAEAAPGGAAEVGLLYWAGFVGPQVSVGIITYDSARQIGRCLASVLGQTICPAEVVVWDNASADESVAQAGAPGAQARGWS